MAASPLHVSTVPVAARRGATKAGELGAKALGFEPMPCQRQVWALLGSEAFDANAVEVPRRAGKTEALFSEAVGRCLTRPDYVVVYAAQSGIKSRARFLSLLRRLGRHHPDGWTAYRARGEEAINFDNGSAILFYPPKSESFRGDAVDMVILDEAQEVDPEDAADLIGSLLPIFDTRPSAQLVVAGTAGASRDGLLWEALTKGRSGSWGILEYAAPEGADVDDEAVWLAAHPGPAGVSPAQALVVLRKRRAEMSDEMFAREYLGIWPEANAAGITPELWESLGSELSAAQPSRFGLAFDVAPGTSTPAVVAAWRDADGVARVEVLAESSAAQIGTLARKHRLPVGYDPMGVESSAVADEIARLFRDVKLRGLTSLEVATSCATLAAAVTAGELRHSRQQALTEAVAAAKRRTVRDAGWMWGRKASAGSIAPLVAATVALRMFDDLPAHQPLTLYHLA